MLLSAVRFGNVDEMLSVPSPSQLPTQWVTKTPAPALADRHKMGKLGSYLSVRSGKSGK